MSVEHGLIGSLSGKVRTLFLAASKNQSLLEKSLFPEDLIQLILAPSQELALALSFLGPSFNMLIKFA